MADPEVKLKFAGSSADAERAIAVLERRLANLENQVKQSGKRMKDVWGQVASGIQDAAGQMLGFNSPVDAAVRGVQLLVKQFDDLVSRQNEAKDANRDFAKTLQNAANNSDGTLAQVKERLLEISEAATVTPQDAARLINIGQASKGNLGSEAVDATIIAASKLSGLDQGTLEGALRTGLGIQKQFAGTTPEQSVGFIFNAMSKSRVEDTDKFTKHVMPAIIGVSKLDGTSLEYSAALSAGITQASEDIEGRKSRTAMTALALQLRDAFPELKDTEARVRAVQENPALRDAFLNGGEVNGRKLSKMRFDVKGPDGEVLQLDTDRASFERQMVPAMEQVLTKGTVAEQIMRASLRDVPSLANSSQEFRGRAKEQAGDSNIAAAMREKKSEVEYEIDKIKNVYGINEATDRANLDRDLKRANYGYVERSLIMGSANAVGYLRGDFNSGAASRISDEKDNLSFMNSVFGHTEERDKAVKILDEILRELQATRKGRDKPPVNRNGQREQ